jgi:hypothetical protein
MKKERKERRKKEGKERRKKDEVMLLRTILCKCDYIPIHANVIAMKNADSNSEGLEILYLICICSREDRKN